MRKPQRPPKQSRRLSITKLQRESAAGAELIALCQTVTEDGSLSSEEVAALEQWLVDHESTGLPARDYLFHTVRKIVADGKVTREEAKELYRAIETVLPVDVREPVRTRRQAVERDAAEQARAERETAKQAQREERERNRPVGSWNFMVAGTRYERRPYVIARYASPKDTVYLIRDRQNRFSRNAVEVRLANGMHIGFVPEEFACDVAPLLDQGLPHEAFITKILTGGRSPIPVVQAYLYRRDASLAGIVLERDVPAKVQAVEGSGCATRMAALASVVLGVLKLAWDVARP
jgi:hypothetical protein